MTKNYVRSRGEDIYWHIIVPRHVFFNYGYGFIGSGTIKELAYTRTGLKKPEALRITVDDPSFFDDENSRKRVRAFLARRSNLVGLFGALGPG